MLSRFLVAAAVTAAALGTPAHRSLQVHEKRDNAPNGYSLTEPASSDTVLNLRLALVPNDTTGLIDALYDVSTPSSVKYGQYLSKEEVEVYTSPKEESVSAVSQWLSENGLNATTTSPSGQWMAIQLPVSQANDLLGANYSKFTHEVTGVQVVRTLTYSIPPELADHVEVIHPTVTFPNPYGSGAVMQVSHRSAHAREFRHEKHSRRIHKRDSNSTMSSPCNISAITPECLQYLYNIPTTPATNQFNQLYIFGYDRDWPQRADLTQFLEKYRPDMNSSATWSLQMSDNGTDPQNSSIPQSETTLDTEYAMSLATDVATTFVSVGDIPETADDFLDYLLDGAYYMLNLTDVPQTVTTSYGLDENLVSEKLATTICNAYAALGARGVSLLFPSGDGGVSGLHYPMIAGEMCTTFVPTFPSTCPYVTSVGGTYNVPEVAATLSGGGFSNLFTAPDYQSNATSTYVSALGSTNSGLYNGTGRGFPDVAAQAMYYTIIHNGEESLVNGTSASSPVFASIISLLNDQLLSAGKPPLGFLNPFLYSTGSSGLTDITSGNNYACSNYTTGFNAAIGWDPVTGLGSPDFDRLKTLVGL
ncbi:family S53 protease [Rhodofomes roseus]|uniref:Family S53 protease n=1 Tax=Rhodofomes roseus TaxID=34475 RepID=A0ABQ8KM72_9APHY|nr:family S53 protease [Rhodofomes roseus]KAH9839170.1 family S53 protease [Rhodofomes roseus]